MGRLSGNTPGGVLKAVIEEHEYLDRFVGLLKRRLNLDKQYIDALQELNQSVQGEWSESQIWSLVGPMMEFFSYEIVARRDAHQTMQAYVNDLPIVESPDEAGEDGERMNEQYRKLADAYSNYEQSHTEASTSTSILELQAWHDSQPRAEYLRTLDPSKIRTFFLPDTNAKYRKYVLRLQEKTAKVVTWHNNDLLNHLEDHQQYSENVRGFIQKLSTHYSEVATQLVAQIGHVRDQAHRFSSSDFISDAHEHQRFEAGHPSMEPVTYMDFYTVKPSSTVVFGTKRETEVVIRALKRLADGKLSIESSSVPDRKEALKLERRFQADEDFYETLREFSYNELRTISCFVLFSNDPILLLTREEVARGSRGMPREKMQPIMDRVSPDYRRLLGDVLITYWSEESKRYTGEACLLLTHRPEEQVSHILRDIYNKWDFEKNCALQKGVKRVWYRPLGKTWLVWERSGLPLQPPT
ncbi:hypothetical protein CPB86DRAFT_758610 [Serendipita vermifera]|nr:hypothetical protein CPB86DRAFT_758610 [Serendipita vermifera]